MCSTCSDLRYDRQKAFRHVHTIWIIWGTSGERSTLFSVLFAFVTPTSLANCGAIWLLTQKNHPEWFYSFGGGLIKLRTVYHSICPKAEKSIRVRRGSGSGSRPCAHGRVGTGGLDGPSARRPVVRVAGGTSPKLGHDVVGQLSPDGSRVYFRWSWIYETRIDMDMTPKNRSPLATDENESHEEENQSVPS